VTCASTHLRAAVRVPVVRVATDERLVGHYVTSEQVDVSVTHGLTNTVKHVPRSARADAILALNLTRRYTVLGRAHFEDHHDPHANKNLCGVHHRSSHH